MPAKTDITLTLPAEYFDVLSVVMAIGLKHASINPLVRKELEAWWSAERSLIEEEMENQ